MVAERAAERAAVRRAARLRALAAVLLLPALAAAARAETLDRDRVALFVERMVGEHGYRRDLLEDAFRGVSVSHEVLERIRRPAEKLAWGDYRKIFITPQRVEQGVEFLRRHAEVLGRAEEVYGVPPEIVAAIIGIETYYGKNKGQHGVLAALGTLAFHYPPRAAFFEKELEQYLLLTRERGLEPKTLKGSYAGAMGIPQFLSSSYRNYAVDFDGDGDIDIWQSYEDAVGSVANYLSRHGWSGGRPVASPLRMDDSLYERLKLEGDGAELRVRTERLPFVRGAPLLADAEARVLRLVSGGRNEYWAGFDNFGVIKRYNRSDLYAMAVARLGELLKGGGARGERGEER